MYTYSLTFRTTTQAFVLLRQLLIALTSSHDPELKCQIWSMLLLVPVLLPSKKHEDIAVTGYDEALSQ